MKLEEAIKKNFDKLNEKDLKVLEAISKDVTDIKVRTSQEVADTLNVSRSYLTRLIKKLGLLSFSDFKYLLNQSNEDLDLNFEAITDQYNLLIENISKESYENI